MRIRRVEGRFRPTPASGGPQRNALDEHGMVATAFPAATEAGARILAQGGNAVDAACAAGFALGVCEPQASGIGGQTVALVHVDGRTFALDGSSRVPSLAHLDRIEQDRELRLGYRATTVPSTPAAFSWLHGRYGRLPWAEVVQPAVEIAREGYEITPLQHRLQERERENFGRVPGGSGARYFLKNGETPYEPGDRFRQPQLADVLEAIARGGAEAFYRGAIAEQIDADMRANDGFLRADDLALIPWPIVRRPLSRRYRGVTITSMPPPGAGRVLLLVMMMLNHLRTEALETVSPGNLHFFAESLRKAFLRRMGRPFDPGTYAQVRNKTLLSRAYARGLADSIRDDVDPSLPTIDPDVDAFGETTHLSVMDSEGNAVSVTQSIELVYGSKAAADGLGFLYNNYLSALETGEPSHPYYLRPGAVPWSTAAPTIVFRENLPWIALGSPGSERIFSSLAQVLSRVVDGSAPLDAAIDAPRLHCSIGGQVSLEAERFGPGVVDRLQEAGYRVNELEPYAFYLGCVQAVLRRQTGSGFQGTADPRRDGAASGPGGVASRP